MALEPPRQLPLAELISSARQKRSLSLSAVAREMQRAAQEEGTHCGATRQAILGYERGRIPHPDALRWLASAIGLPVDELAAAGRQQRRYRRELHLITSAAAIKLTHEPSSATLDEDMERRELLGLLARAAKAGVFVSGLRYLPAASPLPIEDDSIASYVGTLRAVTGHYRKMESFTAAGSLLEPVTAHFTLAAREVGTARRTDAQADIAATASEAAGLAGWLAYDLNDRMSALRHYQMAVAYAEQSGSTLLHVYMLGSMALWAADTDGTDAVRFAGQAKSLMPSNAPTAAQAWMAAVEATAHASVNDSSTSLAALDRAESAVEGSGRGNEPSWPWMYPFDEAKVMAYRGACATRLGLTPMALPALREALKAMEPSTKQRAISLTDLAATYAFTGDMERACDCLLEAFAIGVRKHSGKIVERVRRVRVQLEPWKTTEAVKRLDEQLLAGFLQTS